MRMIAADVLEERGFVIFEAGDALEGLEVSERVPDIALIFTDIDRPGGFDVQQRAAEVSKRWPRIEIIVTSGAVRLDIGDMPDTGMVLPKPYASADLARLV
ncbi:response regulator [Sphingomonas melonis]|uniref:CheY-like chemotaxis protein n=1 Tax=Sphingomonas melonis TaxID=152682 RepID=A0A7Y9FKR8_9SPHN|nr:response regulator [Sphingomonas melonis]NYD89123.1 CheY-like chemotaxis protein [Sphingomonas melonis]